MAHRNQAKLPSNLPQLQNLIKRDHESYEEEVRGYLVIYCNFLYYRSYRMINYLSISFHN